MEAATPQRVRRTQRERRDATRGALVDAAVACLVEYGYAGTTTGRVCERAGLSRGAHLHHFRTRAALVTAALEELAQRRGDDFERELAQLPSGRQRIERGLDLLWGWYTGPLFHAAVDLAAAARTDAELRASLGPVERGLNQTTLLRCRTLFATGPDDRSVDQLIQMALATVRGLALLPVLQPDSHKATKQWSFARVQLAQLFSDWRATRDR